MGAGRDDCQGVSCHTSCHEAHTTRLMRLIYASSRQVRRAGALTMAWLRPAMYVQGCGGRFPSSGGELFLGNAGTAMRPLTAAVAAAGRGTWVVSRCGSLVPSAACSAATQHAIFSLWLPPLTKQYP
jgi:hypothetical protein